MGKLGERGGWPTAYFLKARWETLKAIKLRFSMWQTCPLRWRDVGTIMPTYQNPITGMWRLRTPSSVTKECRGEAFITRIERFSETSSYRSRRAAFVGRRHGCGSTFDHRCRTCVNRYKTLAHTIYSALAWHWWQESNIVLWHLEDDDVTLQPILLVENWHTLNETW